MTKHTLSTYACYETRREDADFPWLARLHGGMNDAALRDYFFAQCSYGNRGGKLDTVAAGAESILKRNVLVLAGGIVARKGDFVLLPGCCSGIETWSDWRGIKKNGHSPWMGHDPDPWIDTSGERAVLYEAFGKGAASAEAGYDEIQSALDGAEKDLRRFIVALEDWLKREGAGNAAAVAEKIRTAYGIPK